VVSPWSKSNFVDHTITDQSSVVKFIEDNWLDGQRIQGSFDSIAGSLENMFNFDATPNNTPFLVSESSGEPINPTQSATPFSALRHNTILKSSGSGNPTKQ
jgi:phospholipase C